MAVHRHYKQQQQKSRNIYMTRAINELTMNKEVFPCIEFRDGPLENLWRGRAKYKKKYSRKAKLNENKFMHAN